MYFVPFGNCGEILSILDNYKLLFKTHENNFTRYFFDSMCDLNKIKLRVTFDNFVEIIWNTFIKKCREFLNDIRERTINLKTIYEIEENCTKCDELESQLRKLNLGIEAYLNHDLSKLNHAWISESVCKIKSYLSTCNQVKAANMILQLKTKLKITGDFEIVAHMAQQFSTTMQEKTLNSIETDIVGVASFFEEIVSCTEKRKCIEIFSDCLDIVEWIKNGKYK